MVNIIKLWRSVSTDRSGNFGLLTALLAVPVIGSIGVAIDISRGLSAKSEAQDALDAALLYAAREPADGWKSAAGKAFVANIAQFGFTVSSLAWVDGSDGSLTGRAALSLNTTFTRILGIESFPVSVDSAVFAKHETSPMIAMFSLDSAKGWYWKQVKLWVHYPNKATDTVIATYTYQPTSWLNGGTGTVTGPLGKAVSLGVDYDNAYLTMQVSPDGCGPGYRPTHPEAIDNWDEQYWVDYSCSRVTTSKTKTASTWTFNSSDQDTADHLFIDGKSIETAQPITKLIMCDKAVTQSWEDTQAYNVSEWESQDIVFTVKGQSCVKNPKQGTELRLIH